jgi:serine/threonine-protein kinase
MQKYGMFLADGGNIALTAKSDTNSAVKWEGLLDAADLAGLKVTDFEMVEGGSRQPVTHDCNRTAM